MRKFSTWELEKVGDVKVSEDTGTDICQCRYCGRLHRPLAVPPWRDDDAKRLSTLLAYEIGQSNEIDNLGDSESIVLIDKMPTINLVQLAEKILEWCRTKPSSNVEHFVAKTKD